ncbi:MAG TPA: rod shape-determining protein MreC [Erythrobacter sp.]|nr:rod shape-determining protein MreC [Erythrobacter sp.]
MAPPSSRRSGHSRRAQYSLFTSYVIAAAGAVLGAVLLGVSLWQPSAMSGFRGAAADATEPAGQAAAAVRAGSGSLLDDVAAYFRAGSQNAALREELELARIRLAEAEATRQENARLKALIELSESEGKPVAMTRIISSTSTSARRFAYIGAGRLQGVRVGMPVRSERGVVGRIREVGASTSRVLLLTDSESVLPVRRASDSLVAFAEGRGNGLLRIRLINLGINPLKPGDVFVTSGTGGYYRPGVAVAVVTSIQPDGGLARMIADPAGTNFVRVDPIWQQQVVEAATLDTTQPAKATEPDQ